MIGLHFKYSKRGPGKVISNLIKGFDDIGVEYILNIDGDKNIILQDCDRLNGDVSGCLVGPNVCTLPIDNSIIMSQNYDKLLVPSDWVKKLYSKWVPEEKIHVWGVGIDTNKFKDSSKNKKEYDFLIYFKRRGIDELNHIINFLKDNNYTYFVIEYGKYIESEFIDIISKSKRGIVIDNCESQGIAIEEMMSCNLPLIVWDVTHWVDRGEQYKCEATSIPYWDSRCGEFFYDINNMLDKFNLFMSNRYNPREYILENLTTEKQSKKILKIYE